MARIHWGARWLVCVALLLWAVRIEAAEPVNLERMVSREDAKFEVARSRMTIGRDGRLYFASGEYLLRMERDGSQRVGFRPGTAMTRGTANADGVVATGHAHFSHAVKVWRADFSTIGEVGDFLNNDQVQYFSPTDVQAGASDFYGYDANQDRIVRVSARGKLVRAYRLDKAGLKTVAKMPRFRVHEARERFFVRFEKFLWCVGFDGALIWKVEIGAEGNLWDGWQDVFDVDADGRVLVLSRGSDELQVFGDDGKRIESVPLELGDVGKVRLEDLAVWQDEVFVKRTDPVQLCSVFERKSGKFKRSLRANVETFRATIGSNVWTAGEEVEISIGREARSESISDRVWLRPYNTPDFLELPISGARFHRAEQAAGEHVGNVLHVRGKITVPADASGLYQVRISPDVRGGACEYQLDTAVEIRVPNARGSISVMTPLNRLYFGRGESIPVSVVTRTKFVEELPRQWQVRLIEAKKNAVAKPEGEASTDIDEKKNVGGAPASVSRNDTATFRPLHVQFVLTTPEKRQEYRIAPHITRALPPGRYVLTVEAPGFTVAAQHLVIGSGIEQPDKFSLVQHGDYTSSIPASSTSGPPSAFEIPELVAANSLMTRKLSLNLFVDRIGAAGAGVKHLVMEVVPTDELFERLKPDPLSISPEKARVENALRQTLAARGAFGQEERGILLMMDAGLPIGTGFDKRTAEQRAADMREVYDTLKSYPAFRGWSWAANWWLDKTGAEAAKDEDQKTAYRAAIKQAKEAGEWSPVLDEVSDAVFAHAVQAERELRNVQDSLAPGLISAMTGPYRAVYTHPPIAFRNADEVDLHYQMEQIQPPNWTAHAVDFLKRPNKRAWGHPEIWNDSGRGEMLFPTVLPMAMRGADGIGWSGRPREWLPSEDDSRSAGPGLLSMLRALNEFWTVYGPWHTTLENRDRVAIVVSTRMQRIGGWHSHLGSEYHERLVEAYNACLYAHRPARFLFVEDLRPESLQHLQAILVVGQTVELDPSLAATLAEAKKSDIKVYADGTCREELIKDFEPLGVSFDRLNNAGELAQDDSLFGKIPRWYFEHAVELKEKLKDVTPVAICSQPEVLLFERFSGDARFVWAVNNTMPLETNPGQAWRTGTLMSERAPVIGLMDLRAGADFIYDVMDLHKLPPNEPGKTQFAEPIELIRNRFLCDLRSTPFRLYACLPKKPHQVVIQVDRGEAAIPGVLSWTVKILDEEQQPINANLPIRVYARGADKTRTLNDAYTTTLRTDGARGEWPRPHPAFGNMFTASVKQLLTANRAVESKQYLDDLPGMTPTASEHRYGPHLKDVTISSDGHLGLVSAFNGHENLFCFETATGNNQWSQRIGDHVATQPLPAGDGFAVQTFDRRTAEGYHLSLLNAAGEAERRFALFGLPKRATAWAHASHIADRGISNFTVSPDGSWIAVAGDLGVAIWSRNGALRWSDETWPTDRIRRRLLALDESTLLIMSRGSVTAHETMNGEERWSLPVVPVGEITGAWKSGDGKTIVVKADTDGGRVIVIRDRNVIGTIHGAADVARPTPDGRYVLTTHGSRLKWSSDDGQLVWQFSGDESLRNPEISPDGQRVVVSSELGTLTVLSRAGEVIGERDMRALAVSKFLTNGDLIVATWAGDLVRFDSKLNGQWMRHLAPFGIKLRPPGEEKKPDDFDIKFQFGPLPDNWVWAGWPITINVPISRVRGWGNAAKESAPLTPNLLAETQVTIDAISDPQVHGDPREWQNDIAMLTDGKPDAPPQPWLPWHDINLIDSGWRNRLTFVADTFREQIRLTGVTFVEDGAHPESFVRDVRLQWWNATDESWVDGPMLLWDADVDRPEGGPPESSKMPKREPPFPIRHEPIAHTHWLDKPIEAARFRFVSTGGGSWPVGNLRLGELVFHGERLGCSHPDAVAKKPLAVLFDENEAALRDSFKHGHNPQFDFGVDGAFSGGKFLLLKQAGTANALFRRPFGHAIPNWNFEIAEKPAPGQYRYLQFAWKANAPETTGLGLLIGRSYPGGGYAITCGDTVFKDGTVATHKVPGPVPQDWKLIQVDLWSLFPKDRVTIQSLTLQSSGGGAAFDRIQLATSPAEFEKGN